MAAQSDPGPFRLDRPARPSVPFLFASPHSGRSYPPSLLENTRLDAITLRRSEDAFVDELFAGVVKLGAPLLAAQFPRAFLDVNRNSTELDAGMFDAPLKLPVDAPSPRVTAGLGVIPRIVRDGAEIYRAKLDTHEADARIKGLYRPYHQALAQLMEETHARFGVAVLIDCHSMPSAAAVPDVVLGDRYGISAAASVMRAAERAFAAHGFSVARNSPYAGGYTTHLYGRPARGVHALQVEINRALYLDEERVTRGPRFGEVQARLSAVLRELTALEIGALRGPIRHAAE
jgi:N-formylglutamate amidohydrolase